MIVFRRIDFLTLSNDSDPLKVLEESAPDRTKRKVRDVDSKTKEIYLPVSGVENVVVNCRPLIRLALLFVCLLKSLLSCADRVHHLVVEIRCDVQLTVSRSSYCLLSLSLRALSYSLWSN